MKAGQAKSLVEYRKSRKLSELPVIYAGIALLMLLLIIYVNRGVLFIDADMTGNKRRIDMLFIGAGLTLSGSLVGVSSYFAYRTSLPGGKISSVLFTATGWKWCVASIFIDAIALGVFGSLVIIALEISKDNI